MVRSDRRRNRAPARRTPTGNGVAIGVIDATKRNLGLARSFLDYMRRAKVVEPPHYFNIDPISACNLKCRMCPQSDPENKIPIGRMPIELYERILSEIRSFTVVDGLSLFLAGEPLLHTQLPEMVRMAVARLGARPNIASNGMRLTRDVAEELLDAGAGMFQIDFCADAEYFDAMAPPGKWEVVRDNLMGLFALISSRSFQPAVVLKDLDWRGETAQEREASLRRLQDVLGEAYSFVRYQSYRLHNWSGDFSAKAESHFGYRKHWGPTYHPCSHLWLAMNIHWNGNVSICCRDLL